MRAGSRIRKAVGHRGAGPGALQRPLNRTPVAGRWSAGLPEAAANVAAIERPDGPVTDALLEAGLTVVVISPNQLENLRSPYGSASVRVRVHPETSPLDSSPLSAIVVAGARRHQSRPRIGRTRPFERCPHMPISEFSRSSQSNCLGRASSASDASASAK